MFDRGRGAEEAGRLAALVDMTGWEVLDDEWCGVEGSHKRRAEVVAQYFFTTDRLASLLCVFEYEAKASASAAWETTKP